ncbi:glycosyltransferase [Oxynema aestuarii]|uniref:Glycosyltransferase family 4 protein n=1 Tax=Oxynema aestuarii AP17 TaxID=2064643 RepID=A0A6H1TUC8_9CYAN|nr:glycosyltransferase [Oxynema aestuarii]QIZ69363.1 glycosyltransferase family 4 protein [Oxynema aestuarii AP17]
MINLHLALNSITGDSRILKETQSIADSNFFERVEIAGIRDPEDLATETLGKCHISRFSLRGRGLPKDLLNQGLKYLEWHWRVVQAYANKPLTVIHCHDFHPLAIAIHLKQLTGAKIVYDAHELETERTGLRGMRQSIVRLQEKLLWPYIDAFITVSPSIKAWYQSHYTAVPTALVRNIPNCPLSISPKPLRQQFKVPDRALLFLYFGYLSKARGIELCLEAFQSEQVPHHLLFMGDGSLKEVILAAQKSCPRIHWLSPVPHYEVVNYAAGADVGISLIEDVSLNERYVLPNKLFESLLGGIPVLASALPDQSEIINTYNAGWLIQPSRDILIDWLTNITPIEAMQLRHGLRERVNTLTWQKESEQLVDLYQKILKI